MHIALRTCEYYATCHKLRQKSAWRCYLFIYNEIRTNILTILENLIFTQPGSFKDDWINAVEVHFLNERIRFLGTIALAYTLRPGRVYY